MAVLVLRHRYMNLKCSIYPFFEETKTLITRNYCEYSKTKYWH